jgi:hypothetical protein
MQYYNFSRTPDGETVDVADYDVAWHFEVPVDEEEGFGFGGSEYHIRYSDKNLTLDVVAGDETVVELPLASMLENLRDHYAKQGRMNDAPGSLMTTGAAGESLRAKLLVLEIQWREEDDDTRIQYLDAIILLNAPP